MESKKASAIKSSAFWAAYGDALGFISEITDEAGLRRRLNGRPLEETVVWKRKVGGPFGMFIDLPAGCYSDDTQLRLATARSIRGASDFDVEAFAKIELPVWLSYDLGAGTSTKAAAASLASRNTNWFSNFFSKGKTRYVAGGGNGAAMGIQPHVWSARQLRNPRSYLRDVIRNTVATHGHPRAILGAAFHAVCLAYALDSRQVPDPRLWRDLV